VWSETPIKLQLLFSRREEPVDSKSSRKETRRTGPWQAGKKKTKGPGGKEKNQRSEGGTGSDKGGKKKKEGL